MVDRRSTESHAHLAAARITYVGHATILLELGGMRILTDPVLRNRISFLRRRKLSSLSPALHRNIDAVLLSHLHHDHLDPPSLRTVGVEVRVLAPNGSGDYLRGKGMKQVHEMSEGDVANVGSLRISATHANHERQRHPFGAEADCLGFVIEGKYSIYFPGDTDLFSQMSEIGDDLDIALLPVWGWGPTLGSGHLTPRRAAEALRLLRPRLAIPIHWGALYPAGLGLLNMDFMRMPPVLFAQHAAEIAPDVTVQILQPGHSLLVDDILG